MADDDVYELVISRLFSLYGPPNPSEATVPACLAEYAQAFASYLREDLVRGMNEIISTNEFRMWPTIGAINKAIASTRPYRAPPIPVREPDIVRTPAEAAHAAALVAKLKARVAQQAEVITMPAGGDGKEPEPKHVPAREYFAAGERRLYERHRAEFRAQLEDLALAKFPAMRK